MQPSRHVILISCQDSPGLIHKITGALLDHKLNIIENHEFVDRKLNAFFMRTEVEGATLQSGTAGTKLKQELESKLPPGAKIEIRARAPKKLILLATKEPHCLGDLLLRHESGELNAEILAVVSQYTTLEKLVKRFDLPFIHVPVDESKPRVTHEESLKKVIDPFKPDFLVLAKYMRILSAEFVAHYPNQIINIHHSFLPAFIGKNPYAQAYERGVKIIGATSHFVNDQLDEGPIITQSVIPVNHAQDAADLARAGRDVEKIVLARALHLVLEDRVLLHGQRTLVFE